MDILDLFLERHEVMHARQVPMLLDQLTEEQMRFRYRSDMNSIAWLLWHMARCEDMGTNIFIAGCPSVLTQGWEKKLGISRRDIGTGMTDEEVAGFSDTVNVKALRDYYDAVGRRTVEVVKSLDPRVLDEVPDPETTPRLLAAEGMLAKNAEWVWTERIGRTKGWWLIHVGVTHNFSHWGEARIMAALQGIKGPR